MIVSKKIKDAKFVMSKDELTYQEVLDDFATAKSIHILTFNISKKQSELLNALKQCDNNTNICIVSNLPDRWGRERAGADRHRSIQCVRGCNGARGAA